MARPLPAPHDELQAAEESEFEAGTAEGGSLAHWASSHAPWWAVSTVFHGLAIILLSLITMSIGGLVGPPTPVTTTLIQKPILPSMASKPVSESPHTSEVEFDTPATHPESEEASTVSVPPDVQAKYSGHFETDNPDRPDHHNAFGNPDAHIVYLRSGSDDAPGGGGLGGQVMDDLIGASGDSRVGTGGGWFGGDGTGKGPDKGNGVGTWGRFDGGGRDFLIKKHGGSKGTKKGVDLGLAWLAKHQEVDGHWDCVKYGGKQADVATTGLALLAFLGHGHTEKIGAYRDNVKRAIYWLISIQNSDGSYFKQGETHGIGYHHAIAGLAMVEAAGMGRVLETIQSAQKGVNYSIDKHQSGEGSDRLGWRYNAKQEGDLSVSGWFIMQLKSAKVAGLKVDPAAFQGAIKFLDRVEQKAPAGETYGGHRYGYKEPSSTGHRRTAIGCLGRQFLGWKRDELQGGVSWFVEQGGVPEWGANGGSVDLYYWYYGSLCVFQQDAPKGPLWTRWNEAMKKALCENQRKGGDEDGSWDPVGAYSDYWGRAGQTALSALCLEVYYRYNLMCKE